MLSVSYSQKEFSYSLEQIEAIYWGKSYESTPHLHPQILERDGTYAFALPSVNILAMNRVIGWGWSSEKPEEDLRRLIEFYQRNLCPRFFLQLSPLAPQTENLIRLLKRSGFKPYNRWAKLGRPIGGDLPSVQSFFDIQVIGRDLAEVYGRTLVESFEWKDPRLVSFLASAVGKTGYKHYLLYYEGKVAAAGALHVQGQYASMAFAGTLAKYRSMGAQHLLIRQRIQDAYKLGARYLFAETAEDKVDSPVQSFRNLQHFGFDPLYLRDNWLYEF